MDYTEKQIEFLLASSSFRLACEWLKPYAASIASESTFALYVEDTRLLDVMIPFVELSIKLTYYGDFFVYPCYNKSKYMLYCRSEKMKKIVVDFPYATRSTYYPMITEINTLVTDGVVSVCANNNPYSLEAKLAIECSEAEMDKVLPILSDNRLSIDTSQTFFELLQELEFRKWNIYTLGANTTTAAMLHTALLENPVFLFAELEQVIKNGYIVNQKIIKPKIFVSYCHDNITAIDSFTEKLKKANLTYWLDREDLQSGTSLLRSIMTGIADCDIAVTFVSNATLKSAFAKAELEQIMTAAISKGDKWCFVRLDDVAVNDIIPGLDTYYYIDYTVPNQLDRLIEEIKIKCKSL